MMTRARAARGDGVAVRIADKGFAESFIVAQTYAQALAAQGFDADVTSLASTEIADKAIRDGEIDVYPEYVGTSYQTVLGLDVANAPDSREAQFEEVKTAYEQRGLTALTPAPVQQRQRGRLHPGGGRPVRHHDPLRPGQGVGATSSTRPTPSTSPAPTACRCSSASTASTPRRSRPSTSACATSRSRTARRNCVYAFGTDPKLGQLDLVLIEDDKGAYSAGLSYQTFPVVNKAFYDGLTEEQRTSFTETLDTVNAALTQEAIIPLISRVEFDQEDPEVVAQEFLNESGVVAS